MNKIIEAVKLEISNSPRTIQSKNVSIWLKITMDKRLKEDLDLVYLSYLSDEQLLDMLYYLLSDIWKSYYQKSSKK